MPPWVAINEEYGPVGNGWTKSIIVSGDDGSEYIAKGPSLVNHFRHVAANELVAAGIAAALKLITPDYAILTRGRRLFFGSKKFDEIRYHPAIDSYLLDRCSNVCQVYELVVFDAWICNTDRHDGQFQVKCAGEIKPGKRCGAADHLLTIIDHEQSLLPDDREPTYFASLLDSRISQYVPLLLLRNMIIDPIRLGAAITAVESVQDEVITGIVSDVPEELLAPEDKPGWIDFLANRKRRLRCLFNGERDWFRWLKAGAL